jgi:hypothetical protein
MKKTILLLTALASLVIANVAQAGDVELKQQLVGTWHLGNDTFTLNSSGISVSSGLNSDGTTYSFPIKCDVKNGMFIETIGDESPKELKILSLTKHKCVVQDMWHGHHIGEGTR